MSDDDNTNSSTDFSDRHVRLESPHIGEVVVRDDREDLETIEETANRLFDRLEEAHEENGYNGNSGGMYE